MLHPALKRLSITVFAAFAVTGSAALLFCLRCIPAEIREFRDIGKDSLVRDSEHSAILVNGVLFFAVSPLGNNFDNATDARVEREMLLCFAVFFFSAICVVIALIISYRGKRYELKKYRPVIL